MFKFNGGYHGLLLFLVFQFPAAVVSLQPLELLLLLLQLAQLHLGVVFQGVEDFSLGQHLLVQRLHGNLARRFVRETNSNNESGCDFLLK